MPILKILLVLYNFMKITQILQIIFTVALIIALSEIVNKVFN